jgi:hypothetical protein
MFLCTKFPAIRGVNAALGPVAQAPTFPALPWLVATLLLSAWPASAAGQDLLELNPAFTAMGSPMCSTATAVP